MVIPEVAARGPAAAVVVVACAVWTACGTVPPERADAVVSNVRGVAFEAVATPSAPAAIGPYSQAIRAGDTLWLAGQIGISPATGSLVAGGIEPETRQVLANIEAVLDEAGFGFDDVVQVQVFLVDLEDYSVVNRIYAEAFEPPFPARAVVEVARLPRDARIEVMMTAAR